MRRVKPLRGELEPIWEGYEMAKTKSSTSGKQQKKIVVVKPYTKKDGTKISKHCRSTPN